MLTINTNLPLGVNKKVCMRHPPYFVWNFGFCIMDYNKKVNINIVSTKRDYNVCNNVYIYLLFKESIRFEKRKSFCSWDIE